MILLEKKGPKRVIAIIKKMNYYLEVKDSGMFCINGKFVNFSIIFLNYEEQNIKHAYFGFH